MTVWAGTLHTQIQIDYVRWGGTFSICCWWKHLATHAGKSFPSYVGGNNKYTQHSVDSEPNHRSVFEWINSYCVRPRLPRANYVSILAADADDLVAGVARSSATITLTSENQDLVVFLELLQNQWHLSVKEWNKMPPMCVPSNKSDFYTVRLENITNNCGAFVNFTRTRIAIISLSFSVLPHMTACR